MSKHTPGPWWLDDDGFVASGSGDTYATVADPHCGDRDIDERESNARLIAAAPELLAALQSVMTWWAESVPPNGADDDMPPQIFDAAHAALAKATGEQP